MAAGPKLKDLLEWFTLADNALKARRGLESIRGVFVLSPKDHV
jgi:hypothetical protein